MDTADEKLLDAIASASDFHTMSFNIIGRLSWEAYQVILNSEDSDPKSSIYSQWLELFHMGSSSLEMAVTSNDPRDSKNFITMRELLIKFKRDTLLGDRLRELCYAKLAKEKL